MVGGGGAGAAGVSMADEQVKARAIRACRDGAGDCGLSLAYQIKDWELCAYIVNRWLHRLMISEANELMGTVVDQLPAAVAERYVSIVTIRRFLAGELDDVPDESRIWRPALPPTTTPRQRSAALAEVFITQAALRWSGRFDRARDLVKVWQPEADIHRRGRYGRGPDITALWMIHAGVAHELAGDREQARQRYADGWQLREYDESGIVAFAGPARRAAHDALRGHNPDTRTWLARVPDGSLGVPGWDAFVPRARAVAELALMTDRLDLDEAAAMAAVRDDRPDRDEFWTFTLWVRCRALLAAGKPLEALAAFDETLARPLSVLSPHGIAVSLTSVLRAEIMLALGRTTHAANILATLPLDDVFAAVPRARLHLMSGAAADAVVVTETFLVRAVDLPRVQRELQLIRAAAAIETGQIDAAVAATRDALRNAREHEDPRAFLTVPRSALAKVVDRVPGLGEVIEELESRGCVPTYPERGTVVQISARERVLLEEICRSPSASVPAIAARLVVSSNTVKTQMKSLFKKFEVGSRADLVTAAGRMGFLDPDS